MSGSGPLQTGAASGLQALILMEVFIYIYGGCLAQPSGM